MEGKFVLALDVGTTTVRCHVLDTSTETVGTAFDQVELLYPEVGREEIEPELLWKTIVKVMREAVKDAGITANQLNCLGISTQRSSFITWHKKTGKTFHNFITWKDVRADSLVRQWNDSYTMKGLRAGSRFLYSLSRCKRFLAGSVLRFMNSQVTMRLVWALQNIPALQAAANQGLAMFGTVDTWLLYRMSGATLHVTDVSNASATGFFDPFTMQWSGWALKLFRIPESCLPEVWDTVTDFGCIQREILGATVPIRCLMADQAASMFGSCCFQDGDVKVTMGTGTFLNVNTGTKPHASVTGLYPQVGWRVGDEVVYVVEGASNDTGSLINWALQVGLLKNPTESTDLASSVKDSDGVFFIPAFSGLQAPINDFQAASGFLGIKPTSTREHLVRAILESIVFRVVQLLRALDEETKYTYSSIRVDGGVSRNDFVSQLLADLSGLAVERPCSTEMSSLGAGFFAGIASGVWKSREELKTLRKIDRVFLPKEEVSQQYDHVIHRWYQAMERFLKWYPVPTQ